MIPIEEIVRGATQPLVNSDTWYGVWFALAMRKEIRKFFESISEHARERIFLNDEEERDDDVQVRDGDGG